MPTLMRDILHNYKIFHIDPKKSRSGDFYKNMLEIREHFYKKYADTILPPEKFSCHLCGEKTASPFLEYKNYTLFECLTCGLVSPNIDINSLQKKEMYESPEYQKDTRREILDTYEYRKNTLAPERLSYILEKTGTQKEKINLLDVGSGPGYFLKYLQELGVRSRGIELSKSFAQISKERGLDVEEKDVKEVKNESCNILTLFDVLEHIANPIPFFKTLNQKLVQGGFVCAHIPNIHSIAYALMKEKQNTLYPFQHLSFYDEKSLDYLAQHSGFSIHAIDSYGLDVMDYFCYLSYRDNWDYLEAIKDFIPAMQALIDKENLSNHLRVIFKKA